MEACHENHLAGAAGDRPKRIKDIRTKCVQTVFGAFRFRGRRYRSCGCRADPDGYRQDFPLGEIIPRRTTPEVRYLFAELGARMPYRAASRILKVCGFGDMRASHMAIRRHTLAMGRELEAQRLDAADGQAVQAPETILRLRKPSEPPGLCKTTGGGASYPHSMVIGKSNRHFWKQK
jgi:hypothetical protein